ncbi:MAG: DUF4214 domain-containing protein [Acidimicrobiales bacterium]|nr:DUF4214 domain-containing protein [Acidimicrobiales bacterium]
MRRAVAAATVVVVLSTVLGLAAPASAEAPPAIPSFVQVAAGLRHSCAIDTSGEVWCWGTNASGILGDPAVEAAWYPRPVDDAGTPLEGATVTEIAADAWATCAVTSVGALACWGSNYRGVNGDGGLDVVPKPKAVVSAGTPLEGKVVTGVDVGSDSACAIADGAVACWGDNGYGQLGVGDDAVHRTPTAVTTAGTVLDGETVVDVAVGSEHACAVTGGGVVACWGRGLHGVLGQNDTADQPAPVAVKVAGTPLEGAQVVDVDVDANQSCALTLDSRVACWGAGPAPYPITELGTAASPLAGRQIAELRRQGRTCARTVDGRSACWSGGWTSPPTGGIALTGTVADLSSGSQHTCATTTSGQATCWGDNAYGQLGRSTANPELPLPVGYGVPTPPAVTSMETGQRTATIGWTAPASSPYPITGYRLIVRWGFLQFRQVDLGPDARSATVTGLPASATLAIVLTASNQAGQSGYVEESVDIAPRPSTVAPFADWDAFTTQQFADMLGRAPTAAELATWRSALQADPTQKGALVEQLRTSTDHEVAVDPGVRLYRAFLGRIPDASGLEFWVRRRRTGSWTLVRMADHFASSSEFIRTYGTLTNREYVLRIYTDVLGRDADPTGVDYWTRQLDLRRRNRGSVMVGFSDSSEYRRMQEHPTDSSVAYIFLLGRAPTPEEEATWTSLRSRGESRATLLRELLDGDAYAARFGD